jgi:hypothetical protein
MTHYLAAPLAHPTPEGRRRNLARALLAGRLVGATVVPHLHIAPEHAPGYPDENETPEQREAAMAACLAAVVACERLTVLMTDHLGVTDGCRAEVRAWVASRRGDTVGRVGFATWADLHEQAVAMGLWPEWRALR